MTTGTRIDPQDREFRRWAADQLGTSPAAPPTAARAAFGQLLRDADFVPPVQWHAAYKVLAVDPNVATAAVFSDPSIVRDVQDRLRAEIDEFTAEYFDLAPAERRHRWGELKVRSASFRSLSTWLDALAPGLDIRRDMTLNGPQQLFNLFEAVLRNFVLRPTEAAWHRQRFIEECQPEIGAYQYAAQQMQKRYPALAALAPDLVTQLATWSKAQQQREARRKKVRAAMAQAESTTDLKKLWGFAWLIIPFAIGIVISHFDDSKKRSRPPVQVPAYNPQQFHFKHWNEMTEQEKRTTGRAFRTLSGGPDDWKPEDESKDTRHPNPPNGPEINKILRDAKDRLERNQRERPANDPDRSGPSPFDIPDDELSRPRAKPKPDGD